MLIYQSTKLYMPCFHFGKANLPVLHFWEIIKLPLVHMFKECISQGDMTTTMKQGIITDWQGPVIHRQLASYQFVNLGLQDFSFRLCKKVKLDDIISESQSGFIKWCHISNKKTFSTGFAGLFRFNSVWWFYTFSWLPKSFRFHRTQIPFPYFRVIWKTIYKYCVNVIIKILIAQ